MTHHVLLQASTFEHNYLELPRIITADHWRQILTVASAYLDYPLEEYFTDEYAPPVVSLDPSQPNQHEIYASWIVWRACLEECTLQEYRCWTEDFLFATFDNGGYCNFDELFQRLGKAGYRLWRRFLNTAGVGSDTLKGPWWTLTGEPKMGLTAPVDLRNLVGGLQMTQTLQIWIDVLRGTSDDPVTKSAIRDIETIFSLLQEAAQKGYWVMGYEWGT